MAVRRVQKKGKEQNKTVNHTCRQTCTPVQQTKQQQQEKKKTQIKQSSKSNSKLNKCINTGARMIARGTIAEFLGARSTITTSKPEQSQNNKKTVKNEEKTSTRNENRDHHPNHT